jgi:hypothetical protein
MGIKRGVPEGQFKHVENSLLLSGIEQQFHGPPDRGMCVKTSLMPVAIGPAQKYPSRSAWWYRKNMKPFT